LTVIQPLDAKHLGERKKVRGYTITRKEACVRDNKGVGGKHTGMPLTQRSNRKWGKDDTTPGGMEPRGTKVQRPVKGVKGRRKEEHL